MKDEAIELPPLPAYRTFVMGVELDEQRLKDWCRSAVRQAIEADRQARGEPVVCSECGGDGAGGAHEDDCQYAQPPQAPEGYKIVPIEPTAPLSNDKLLALLKRFGFEFHYDKYVPGSGYGLLSRPYTLDDFRAMLEAAPEVRP